MKLTSEIEKICATGCNVTIDASHKLTSELIKLAEVSHKSGGMLTIKNCDRFLTSELQKIGASGKGHVTIDLS